MILRLVDVLRLPARMMSLALLVLLQLTARAAEPVHLTLWQGFKFSEVTMLRENVRDFTERWNTSHQDKIAIQIDQVPFDEMVRKIKSAAPARMLPDIAFVDANKMVQLAYGGAAAAVEQIPGFPSGGIEELRTRYVPGAFDTNIVQFRGEKHLYGIPAQTTTLALFWNKRMFAKASAALQAAGLDPSRAPRDWDEFTHYGKILTNADQGIYGFGMNNSLWFTMPFLNQYGVELVRRQSDGRLVPSLLQTHGAEAIQRKANLYLKDKVEAGAWREGSLSPDQGFQNEKYAMILTGPWMIENFRSAGLDFGVSLIPRVPLAEAKKLGLIAAGDVTGESTASRHLSAGNVGGQNLIICSTCRRKEIALAFALEFTNEQVQRRWAEELGQIPVLLAAQQNLKLTRFPEVPVFMEQVKLAKPWPALPFTGTLETEIFNPEVNLVLQGKQSAEQASRNIEAAMALRILDAVNRAEEEEKVRNRSGVR